LDVWQFREPPAEFVEDVVKQPLLAVMRTQQPTVEFRYIAKRRHGFLLRSRAFAALRYPLRNGIFQVRAQFVPGFFTLPRR